MVVCSRFLLSLMFSNDFVIFSDSASNASLNYSSTLSPYRSSNPIVVRFAVTPVYQLSDVSRLSPIGVLAYGDVLNGKVWIPETVTERFNGEVGKPMFLAIQN
jgi:hypothetical protein